MDDDGDFGSEAAEDGGSDMSYEDLTEWMNDSVDDRFARGELRAETQVDPSADLWADSVIHGEELYEEGLDRSVAGDPVDGVEPSSLGDALGNIVDGLSDWLGAWFDDSGD